MRNLFLKPNNLLLKKRSSKIPAQEILSNQTKKIIEKMLKIAHGEQKNSKKPIMVGLAAPQIGISKRIILVDTKANGRGKVGDLRIYVNPEIIWSSKTKAKWYEGCYSTGKICGIVSRPKAIKIRAIVLKSLGRLAKQPPRLTSIEEKWTGYIARIFQHEIDHLNGILFYDHIKNPDHLHEVEKDEFPLYRDGQVLSSGNKMAWKTWPKKHPLSS